MKVGVVGAGYVGLVTAAGFADGGISFKILSWPVAQLSSIAIYEDMVRAKAAWEKVWPAMKVELDPQADTPTHNRKMTTGDFQMMGYFLNFSPDAALGLQANLGTGGSRNYAKFKDEEIDRKIDLSLTELDLKKRSVILKDIQTRAFDLVTKIWLREPFTMTYWDPKVQGVETDLPGTMGKWLKA